MFNCQNCGKTQGPRTQQIRRVIAERLWTHPKRTNANRDGSDDPGGQGFQIIEEQIIGPCCVGKPIR